MFRHPRDQGKNFALRFKARAQGVRRPRRPGREKYEEAGPGGTRLGQRTPELLVAAAALEIPHLVQPGLLLRALAGQPLPLLDQLTHLLAALVTDLRVELRAARGTDGLAALLADLLVELVSALRLDRLPALASDLLVEGPAALLGDLHSALAASLGNGHSTLLLLRHFLASGGWKEPPPPPSAPSVFKK